MILSLHISMGIASVHSLIPAQIPLGLENLGCQAGLLLFIEHGEDHAIQFLSG